MKRTTVYESDLAPFYVDLVEGAQTGDVNLLSVIEAEMAWHGQLRAEAIYGLGNEAWLDSLDVTASMDSLLLWVNQYDAPNATLTEAGILAAKEEHASLEWLAAAKEAAGEEPQLYGLLKLYAQEQQDAGWLEPSPATLAYLEALAADRDVIGSAQANAWLHALGNELPEEIIILPEESGAKRMVHEKAQSTERTPLSLEAYPNPTAGEQWLVYELPEGVEMAELRVHDLVGRQYTNQRIGNTMGIFEMNTQQLPNGMYIASVIADDLLIGQVKLLVQR